MNGNMMFCTWVFKWTDFWIAISGILFNIMSKAKLQNCSPSISPIKCSNVLNVKKPVKPLQRRSWEFSMVLNLMKATWYVSCYACQFWSNTFFFSFLYKATNLSFPCPSQQLSPSLTTCSLSLWIWYFYIFFYVWSEILCSSNRLKCFHVSSLKN